MPAFQKFNSFVEARGRKVHNLHTDVLKVMWTNTAPLATNTVKADIVEIAAQNGYVAGGQAVAGQSYSQVGGVAKLLGTDQTHTATAGGFGPMRYAVLYNDSATNKELIGYWDYGASFTLFNAGENVIVDFDGVNGILQDS